MKQKSINRILVALDIDNLNQNILQTATRLATQLNAEVDVLFVEDINLLRLAESPVSRELVYGATRCRQTSLSNMERAISFQTAKLQEHVKFIAEQMQLNISFNKRRGNIAEQLSIAAKENDLLVVGKNAQPLKRNIKIGNITKTLLSSAVCNLVLVQHGTELERPVSIFYTGSEADKRALLLAIQLAEYDHKNLKVILPDCSANETEKLFQEATAISQQHDIDAQFIQLKKNSTHSLLNTLNDCEARVFLLDPKQLIFNSEQIQSLIEKTSTTVILTN